MGVILGIDIGGSSTKIVGLHENGTVIDMLRVKAEDPLTSLYGALGNFLATHSLKLTDIGHIALTGVGASYVEGDIYGLPTCKVGEFSASGTRRPPFSPVPRPASPSPRQSIGERMPLL